MHPCLKVPEIVISICQSAELVELTRLALTCRSFSQAVTEVIWSSTYNLDPMLLCLTEELWSEEHHMWSRKRAVGLRREITAKDLEALARGLSRIRDLFFDVFDGPTPSKRAIADISAAALRLNVPHPLGRVRRLHLHIEVLKHGLENWLPALRTFLIPSIEHLKLYAREDVPDSQLQDLLLSDLPQRCQNLRSIDFCQHELILTPSSLNTCISKMSLRRLHLQHSYPHPQLMTSLKGKDTFTDLSITYQDDLTQACYEASDATGAPYLRHLSLKLRRIDATCQLLQSLSPCALETVHLDHCTLTNTMEVRHLIKTLSACLHHASLRRLRIGREIYLFEWQDIYLGLLEESESDSSGGDPYDFATLSVFVNLQELEIYVRAETRIGVIAFQRLANRLPSEIAHLELAPRGLAQLTTLRIGDEHRFTPCHMSSSSPPNPKPTITLADLPVICALFPKLRELELPVYAGDTVQPPGPLQEPQPHGNLRRLRVGSSPVHSESVVDVAQYLATCFPNLQYIGTHRFLLVLRWFEGCTSDAIDEDRDHVDNPYLDSWVALAKEMGVYILPFNER